MREPWFWRSDSASAKIIRAALYPAAALYSAGHRLRWRFTKPYRPKIPVICIGNATVGGVGKTPFAILIADIAKSMGYAPYFLTRGYGGRLKGPLTVDPKSHQADDVGDEALLLARVAPTIVARKRPDGAKLAHASGADLIIMDDGFQNPSLAKTYSILLFRKKEGAIFPAGEFREPFAHALARADCAVHIVNTQTGLPACQENFAAWLEPKEAIVPARVFAFCGIGSPDNFFATLASLGFEVLKSAAFPDHHPYAEQEIAALKMEAKKLNARLITTEKDLVRLAPNLRDEIAALPVEMRVNNRELLTDQLRRAIDEFTPVA